MRKYLKGECPNCGCRLLYNEPATADGAVVLDSDQAVKHGDTVTRCDGCGEHVNAERPTKSTPSKPSKSKRSTSSRSSSAKGKRRPQQSKRARARSGSGSRSR